MSSEIDPISNVILSRLNNPLIPEGPESLKAFQESKRHIKFQFAPGASDNGFVFVICDPEYNGKVQPFENDLRLESTSVPNTLSNIDADYKQYLFELFEIYHNLDNYKYPISLSEIGLKNSNENARRDQNRILYGAVDLMITSLEFLINKKIDQINSYEEASEDVDDSENKIEKLQDQVNDLKEYFSVLNFIKAVYFSSKINFSRNFSLWINKSAPPLELVEEVLNTPAAYQHDFFYKFLNQLLLRGSFGQALSILTSSSYTDLSNLYLSALFESLIKVTNDYRALFNVASLDENDLGSQYNDDPQLERNFAMLFKAFRSNVLEILSDINTYLAENNTTLRSDDKVVLLQLRQTFLVLSGSKSAILKQADSWYEALNGLILFSLPERKLIQEYLDVISSDLSHQGKFEVGYTNVWEVITYNLIKDNNFLLAIRSLELLESNSTCYLSVLLDARGFLKEYNRLDYLSSNGSLPGEEIIYDDLDNLVKAQTSEDYGSLDLCQYLLFNHAMNTFSNKQLVPIGVGVLKSLDLPNFKQILTEYLPYNYFSESNDDSEWLIGVCGENKLIHLSNNLYKLFGLNFYHNGLYLESLENLRKAGEYKWISKIVWEIFAKKLGERYESNDLSTQEVSVIDLVVDQEDFDIDEITILTAQQKSQVANYKLDVVLKRFLAPYLILLKYVNNEVAGNYTVSKNYLIQLINFQYLPQKLLTVLLLYLLKYFYLNFTSGGNYNIGLSIFESQELISILKTLNAFENQLEQTKSKLSKLYISVGLAQKADSYYHEFVKQHHSTLRREYNLLEIEFPKNVAELVRTLKVKISLEMSRKYLE